jgi:hypothetical protein
VTWSFLELKSTASYGFLKGSREDTIWRRGEGTKLSQDVANVVALIWRRKKTATRAVLGGV